MAFRFFIDSPDNFTIDSDDNIDIIQWALLIGTQSSLNYYRFIKNRTLASNLIELFQSPA